MRTLVVWCPDWPATAAAVLAGLPRDAPVAVLAAGRVLACSAAARARGVRRELRRREAQSRCPDLAVLAHNPSAEMRAFEPVVAAVEDLTPGVEVVRPGICAVKARSPARYFGGEDKAATRLTEGVAATGTHCQSGIADGVFAAVLAARQGRIVPEGETAAFLAPLPVAALELPDLADLLRRLGIRTLGEFATLPADAVLARFGPSGAAAHRLARGVDDRPPAARRPPPDLAVRHVLDPPVERVDTAAFFARAVADELVTLLSRRGLACTCFDIEVETEHGRRLSRRWRHGTPLTGADLADRVRWQLDGWLTGNRPDPAAGDPPAGDPAGEGIALLRLSPVDLVPAGVHQEGLWGGLGERGERARRAASRVQSLLGHGGVLAAVCSGGRGPGERVRLVPWGDDRVPARPFEQPWPGHLPRPSPATVLPEPRPATVVDATGNPVGVTGRVAVTASPAAVSVDGGPPAAVRGWAGPWPVEERWWDPRTVRRLARFQVVTDEGAWLLVVEDRRWWVEAIYD